MPNYRPVECDTWKDRAFQEYTIEEKLLFLYLITNKQTTESGIYEVTFKTMHYETGIPEDEVAAIISEKRLENIFYDPDTNCVFVKNFRRHNRSGRPEYVHQSITNDYCKTHLSMLWELFEKEYPELSDLLTTDMKPVAKKPKGKGKKRKPSKKKDEQIFTPDQISNLIANYNSIFSRVHGQDVNSRATMTDRIEKFAAALRERRHSQGIELTDDQLFEICHGLAFAVMKLWPTDYPNKWENIYRYGKDKNGEDCLTKRMETYGRHVAGDFQENEKPAADYQNEIIFNQEGSDEQD